MHSAHHPDLLYMIYTRTAGTEGDSVKHLLVVTTPCPQILVNVLHHNTIAVR